MRLNPFVGYRENSDATALPLPSYERQKESQSALLAGQLVTMWGPAIVMVRVVRPSVCHMQIFPKLSGIDLWLLGNSNRNQGFPIPNLPSDSRREVRFRYFGCFRVGISPIQTEMGR